MAALGGMSHAQGAEPLRWALDEFRTRCVALWSDEPHPECRVAEFGEVAVLDGWTLFFAVYDDPAMPILIMGTSGWRQRNALVLLKADRLDPQEATVLHIRKPERGDGPIMYHVPEVIETELGPVLFLRGTGSGDGSFQFEYDEHWLWRSGALVPLDVHGWLYPMRERMPDGFALKGIGDLRDALRTLTYVSRDVAVAGDLDCCPSGGTLRIRFEWDDLTLRVESFEHDPGGQVPAE
ncbi:MAG: hypothetical protein F4X36_21510 [Gammaproteobacteria bacterium]|nr:hypothetical protein [Gammaproteobacteria bacterium]